MARESMLRMESAITIGLNAGILQGSYFQNVAAN